MENLIQSSLRYIIGKYCMLFLYMFLEHTESICCILHVYNSSVFITLLYSLKGTYILFFIVAAPDIPSSCVGGLPFLHTLSSVFIGRLFDDGRSDQCEAIVHYSFDVHFSSN